MEFINRLTTTLNLTIGSKKWEIPGGNIKRFRFAFHPWGFEAEAMFWMVSQASESEDTLFAEFVKDTRIDAELVVDRTFDAVGESADAVKLAGIVEERELLERAFGDLSGEPVLHRRYRVSFRDPAAVLWSRHRPLKLLVDKTHADLISAETPSGLSVTSSWPSAKTKHPVLSLGLGADSGGAHFIDFVHWLSDRDDFGFLFDADTKKYTLTATRPSSKSEAMVAEDVHETEVLFDPPPRHAIEVLNGAAEASTKVKKVANTRAYTGVRQDRLLVTSIAKDVTDAATAAKEELDVPPARIRVHFARYPSITMRPGRSYDFNDEFSARLYVAKKTYRLDSLVVDAHAERPSATDDSDDDSNSYRLEVVGHYSQSTDERWVRPAFTVPQWPFCVEGKVVSDVGDTALKTFQAHTDSTTKLDYYNVAIPLWSNLKVRTPYLPNHLPGHFYFPLYKDARVLVGLEFEAATVVRHLDWRPGGRLPKDSQGNHILFGKKAEDQTSVRHDYSASKPVLTIARTHAEDLQTVTISEGTIKFETKEEKKK